jgi:hypothetical protein
MNEEGRYDVVWPLGRAHVTEIRPSDRPADLSATRVAFVWDYLFKGDQMFTAIQEHLSARFPGAGYAGYAEFGNIHGSDQEEQANLDALPARLRAARVDSVVIGVGA